MDSKLISRTIAVLFALGGGIYVSAQMLNAIVAGGSHTVLPVFPQTGLLTAWDLGQSAQSAPGVSPIASMFSLTPTLTIPGGATAPTAVDVSNGYLFTASSSQQMTSNLSLTTTWTIITVYKPVSSTANRGIWGQTSTGFPGLRRNPTTPTLTFTIVNTADLLTTTSTVANNTWVCSGVSLTASRSQYYVNGVFEKNGTGRSPASWALLVGVEGANFMDGDIAFIGAWDHEMTSVEQSAFYAWAKTTRGFLLP